MKKIVFILIYSLWTTLIFADYKAEYINVDDMVKGYCEELLAKNRQSAPSDLKGSFRFTQDGNAITIEYSAYGTENSKHSDNLYKDLEILVESAISEIKSYWEAIQAEKRKQIQQKEFEQRRAEEARKRAELQKQEAELKLQPKENPVVTTQQIAEYPHKQKEEMASHSYTGIGYRIGDKRIFSDGTSGIIFYLTDDSQHGAVMSLTEGELRWENVRKRGGHDIPELLDMDEYAIRIMDWGKGKSNTGIIINSIGVYSAPAAAWCIQYGQEWYLPSASELYYLLYIANRGQGEYGPIASACLLNGGQALLGSWYWTSTEYNDGREVYNISRTGSVATEDKSYVNAVRAIRLF